MRMNLWACVAVTLLTLGGLDAEVSVDLRSLACSQVEGIIKGEIVGKQAPNLAATTGDSRCIFLHDCFVEGCGATLMITSAAENKADIDLLSSTDGFDPKTSIIVSCAEIGVIARTDLLTLIIAATRMEEGEIKNRKLLQSREPKKAELNVGQPAQHN